jgi:hypothetical protein
METSPKLQALLSEDFDSKYFIIDNHPGRFRLLLLGDSLVIELRESIKSGEITWEQLESFVSDIASGFKKGFALEGDIALCAIAVAIEDFDSKFSYEYLDTLAKSKAAVLRKPSWVARECLETKKDIETSSHKFISDNGYREFPVVKFHIQRPPGGYFFGYDAEVFWKPFGDPIMRCWDSAQEAQKHLSSGDIIRVSVDNKLV